MNIMIFEATDGTIHIPSVIMSFSSKVLLFAYGTIWIYRMSGMESIPYTNAIYGAYMKGDRVVLARNVRYLLDYIDGMTS